MNLHLERRGAFSSSSGGGFDGVLTLAADPESIFAMLDRGNPLRRSLPLHALGGVDRIVAWSGTLAGSLDELSPLNWMPQGRKALSDFCDGVIDALIASKCTLCLQPHSRHILSDIPSCEWFFKERSWQGFDLALSPATMLEPSMLPAIEDHLERIFATLAPRAVVLFLYDVVEGGEEEDALRQVPLGRGVMPRETTLRLVRQHIPPSLPVVIMDDEIDAQTRWLGLER